MVGISKCLEKKFIRVFTSVRESRGKKSWVRMFDFQWPENLSIFMDNLCFYHICFDLISFITILFTWWFCKSSNSVENNQIVRVAEETDSTTNTIGEEQSNEEDENLIKWNDENIVSNLKIMRQKALVKELQSKLTEDELEEEKLVERKQLEKIFKLLQDQEDKFQMTSMEQVEDQLHLYRV